MAKAKEKEEKINLKDVDIKLVAERYVGYKKGTNSPICLVGKHFTGCLLVMAEGMNKTKAKQEFQKMLDKHYLPDEDEEGF